MITGKMLLPALGESVEFFDRLALQSAFDFVDAGYGRTNTAELAFVLAAEKFWERPGNHIG